MQASTSRLSWLGLTIEEARESAAVREWMEEGRQEGEATVLLRLLERRCGMVPEEVRQAIRTLPQEQLLELADAVLEVRGLEDLQAWLREQGR